MYTAETSINLYKRAERLHLKYYITFDEYEAEWMLDKADSLEFRADVAQKIFDKTKSDRLASCFDSFFKLFA